MGKARPDPIIVGTHQGVRAVEVEVIGDQDQAAGTEVRPQRADRAREDHARAAQGVEQAQRLRELGGRMAFVEVGATLETRHRDAGELAEPQSATVALDRRQRESGQLAHVEVGHRLDALGNRPEARAQDQPDDGQEAGCAGANHLDRGGPAGDRARARAKRQRQELAQRRREEHGAVRRRDVHRRRGLGELGEPLATATARRARRRSLGHDEHLDDTLLAGRDQGTERGGLGALAERVGDVFDVAAGYDAAARRPQRGADGEARIGCPSPRAGQ